MVVHLSVPVLDPEVLPGVSRASFMYLLLGGFLWRAAVTDAMEMRGLTRTFSASEAGPSRAVEAGIDMILMLPLEHLAIESLLRAACSV